ncbi:hypothetical protein EDC04DRAFT_2902792 [Pisolithus marmoratus]|nr:hypothetical protein EDC04DRAFT_2902792 [Pisolithus marmoratus]
MLFKRNNFHARACHSSRFRVKKQVPQSDFQDVDHPMTHVTPASTQASPQIFNTRRHFSPAGWNSGFTGRRAPNFTIFLMGFLVMLSLFHFLYPSGAPALLAVCATPKAYITQTQIVASQIIQQSHRILHRKTPINHEPTPRTLYDYALRRNGGIVLSSLTSFHAYDSWVNRLLGKTRSAHAALEDDLQEGACCITHVMLDHIQAGLTNATEIAPRKLLLWGLVDGEDNLVKYHFLRNSATGTLRELLTAHTAPALSRGMSFIPLLSFDYNIHCNQPHPIVSHP